MEKLYLKLSDSTLLLVKLTRGLGVPSDCCALDTIYIKRQETESNKFYDRWTDSVVVELTDVPKVLEDYKEIQFPIDFDEVERYLSRATWVISSLFSLCRS